MKKKRSKSQVWMSAVLYILIAAVAMVLILQAGIPLLNNMKDRTAYTRTKDTLTGLDNQIEDVASEGQGSQRIIPIEIRQGNLYVDDNTVSWELDTKTPVIEPSTKIDIGNVKVASNVDVDTIETDAVYNVSNSRIRVVFEKDTNPETEINIDNVIKEIYYIDENKDETLISPGFSFGIGDCDNAVKVGDGYTEMIPSENNTNIGSAKIIVHMLDSGNTCAKSYDLELVIESEADFIKSKLSTLNT